MNHITVTRLSVCLVLVLDLLAPGCFRYPATTIPLETLSYNAPGNGPKQLIVYLPGNGDPVNAFDRHGLVAALRTRRLPVDVIAVRAHLGYYMDGSVLTRLRQDVIEPARMRGYRRIWLVGNSLGGYGSVSYARQYPEDIFGVVLLGPFLGDRKIVQEIRDAGGLQRWDPGEIPERSKETWEKELWKWLKDGDQQKGFWSWIKDCDTADGGCPSRIYLGFGKRDRFAYGQRLMAESLPPEDVIVIDGGHDWDTWKKLWDLVLDRMTAPRPATALSARPQAPSP